mgnify:FL=1
MADAAQPDELVVPADIGRTRLDRFLADVYPDHSRAYLQKMIDAGQVLVNDKQLRRRDAVQAGDRITLTWPVETPDPLPPVAFNLPVLHEDDYLLAINKPAGLTVHPGAGTQDGTLVNALLGYDYDQFSAMMTEEKRPGIVHRLDKDTSGVLIVARTPQSRSYLSRAFANRRTEKCYLALVAGCPAPSRGTIETLIGRHPVKRQRMAVVERNGKEAVTHYQVVAGDARASLVQVVIETGRTHQIRVHLAHIGHPVLGDAIYGGKVQSMAPRQMLHAWELTVPHPDKSGDFTLLADLPDDFLACCSELGITPPDEPFPMFEDDDEEGDVEVFYVP